MEEEKKGKDKGEMIIARANKHSSDCMAGSDIQRNTIHLSSNCEVGPSIIPIVQIRMGSQNKAGDKAGI